MYREAELSAPVISWLERRGLTVYAEVPHYSSPIDLIGADFDVPHIVAVELKTSLTKKVIRQAVVRSLAADESYCATPTMPRSSGIDRCRRIGVGVILVRDGLRVLTPSFQKRPHTSWRDRLISNLKRLPKGGVGGMPSIRGEGPAQEVYRKVQLVRTENPKITWREIFEIVPNHYMNFRSMQVAMYLVEKHRRIREPNDRLKEKRGNGGGA